MATAIIMSSVIGAEFHKEIDPINRHSKYSSKTLKWKYPSGRTNQIQHSLDADMNIL